jgi:hypothetical protein
MTSVDRDNRLPFDSWRRHPVRPVDGDRFPLARVCKPTQVANVHRCDGSEDRRGAEQPGSGELPREDATRRLPRASRRTASVSRCSSSSPSDSQELSNLIKSLLRCANSSGVSGEATEPEATSEETSRCCTCDTAVCLVPTTRSNPISTVRRARLRQNSGRRFGRLPS